MRLTRTIPRFIGRWFLPSVILFAFSFAGCGTGERELPVVSGPSAKPADITNAVDYPLGKPAPRKTTGKGPRQGVPIDIPAGPGNK
jgi:hypothetical protein